MTVLCCTVMYETCLSTCTLNVCSPSLERNDSTCWTQKAGGWTTDARTQIRGCGLYCGHGMNAPFQFLNECTPAGWSKVPAASIHADPEPGTAITWVGVQQWFGGRPILGAKAQSMQSTYGLDSVRQTRHAHIGRYRGVLKQKVLQYVAYDLG